MVDLVLCYEVYFTEGSRVPFYERLIEIVGHRAGTGSILHAINSLLFATSFLVFVINDFSWK